MTDELEKALAALKGYKMTEAEMNAQRISFAYGNAPKEDKGTKEAVAKASHAELIAVA
jgi:hypothetical protein